MARGNIFRRNSRPNVQKSDFNMQFDHRTTLDMGFLTPVLLEETMPGDSWTLQCEPFVRAAALLAPVMSRIDVRIDYFHVSNRIVWNGWEEFMKGKSGAAVPYVNVNDSEPNLVKPGSLGDYMGLPAFESLNNYETQKVSALPFAAYNMIWNEFYRHQFVQNDLKDDCDAVNMTPDLLDTVIGFPQYRNWVHDYFTSANPFPAAGANIGIPISHSQAPVDVRFSSDDELVVDENIKVNPQSRLTAEASNRTVYTDNLHEGTIEDLRRAIKIQEWLEKMLRGGERFREILWNFFGVDNRDERMQIPEYIGSHTNSLKISEVLSTADTVDNQGPDTGSPVGQLSGHGVSVGQTPRFKFFARENGWIIGLMSVQPKPTYLNQGMPRKFSREEIYDFPWPQFASFGEQEIYNKELFIDDTQANQDAIFGYSPRYSEFKFRNNRVSGEFGTNLDFWHFARKFVSTPVLDDDFIKASVTVNPFAIKDGSHNLRAMVYHNNRVVRPLPRFSVPKL